MWAEKYRPRNIRDFVTNENAIFTMFKIKNKANFFNLIIQGPFGIGKNSIICLLLNELSIIKCKFHLIELCGIIDFKIVKFKDYITDRIESNFLNYLTKKIIIIKNSDYLSFQNQSCLKKYFENNSKILNFWMTCESLSKMNTSLFSRCIRIPFKKQGFIQPIVRLKEILDKENNKTFLETLEVLICKGNSNFRLYFNFLIQNFYLQTKILSIIINKKYNKQFNEYFTKDYIIKDNNIIGIRKIQFSFIKSFGKKNKKKILNKKNWFYANNFYIFLD